MAFQTWHNKKALLLADGARLSADQLSHLASWAEVIVGIDGGARHALAEGIRLDLLLGDFDSLEGEIISKLTASGTVIQRYPVQKDATDTELALQLAVKSGVKEVVVVSGLGDRLDHSLANLFLLGKYATQVTLTWVTAFGRLYYLSETSPEFSAKLPPDRVFSIIALSNCLEGLSISGAKYPLNRFCLNFGSTVGVSNQSMGGLLEVKIDRGLGVIVIPEVN